MHILGKFDQLLYHLPWGGEKIVRGLNRTFGKINFHSPISGLKWRDSIEEVKADLLRLCGIMNFQVEISWEEPDQFEFFVLECPYGFHRPDQQGVCDAAMDLDRTMFRLCGAELIVKETIPAGAPKCRQIMKKIDRKS